MVMRTRVGCSEDMCLDNQEQDDHHQCSMTEIAIRTEALTLLKRRLRRTTKQTHKTTTSVVTAAVEAKTSQQNEEPEETADLEHVRGEEARVAATAFSFSDRSRMNSGYANSQLPCGDDNNCEDLLELQKDEPTIAQVKAAAMVVVAPSRSAGNSEGTRSVGPIQPSAHPILSKHSFTKMVIKWSCRICDRECIPVREESRCICGHRYKEHPSSANDQRVKDKAKFRAFACTASKCACKSFFYIVAEGAWILRCRCKHKHLDHDASKAPYGCKKPKCVCSAFDSPWICNCNHPWSEHQQETIQKHFQPLQLLHEQCEVAELNVVYRTDLIAEPLVPH